MKSSAIPLYRRAKVQLFLCLVTVLAINGAIPFLTMPTMGQAVWSLGFSQSFANQSIFAIHAINFGQPHPAAIAFGLSAAYPASLLIRLGFPPPDAYTAIDAAWLIIAFFGARAIGKRYDLTETASNLCAVMWLSLPIVWMHVDYSMLALGIALLPTYFFATLVLVEQSRESLPWRSMAQFIFVAVIAVFMDGYTFVMFAVASALYVGLHWLSARDLRKVLLAKCGAAMIAGLATSYILYALYEGHAQFQPDPIETFRAFGVDLGFILLPTWGIQWLPDLLHLETRRLEVANFGDASVWNTSFSLPIIIFAAVSWLKLRNRTCLASTFLAIALLGGYMALGPSFKAFSVRHPQLSAQNNPAIMPASSALFPTGSGRLSLHVPGLKSMRATYRWLALCELGCWLLVLLAFRAETSRLKKISLYIAALTLVALNLPHTLKILHDGHTYRMLFDAMDTDVEKDLARSVPPGSKVAFLPWGNDFLANYLTSRAGLRAFNIGGDKNLAEARAHWPREMRSYSEWKVDPQFSHRLALQLAEHEIDIGIIPYFDMLWSAHFWPCVSLMADRASSYVRSETRDIDDACPDGIRIKMAPIIKQLAETPGLQVEQHAYFAIVKLGSSNSVSSDPSAPSYPMVFGSEFPKSQSLLRAGWFPPESGHVWSGQKATLAIPLTAACRRDACIVTIVFNTFAASRERPVELHLTNQETGRELACTVSVNENTMQIQATIHGKKAELGFSVLGATSPAQLNIAPDPRVLGISLLQIDVRPGTALPGDAACDRAL